MTQQTAPTGAEPTPAPAEATSGQPAPADPAFASPRLRLDRLSTVREGTVVVVFDVGRGPLVRGPGDLLVPGWVPWHRPSEVLVVTTEPVTLRVRVDSLLTLDGETMALVELDVVVRLQESEVTRLVEELGDDLGPALVLEVQHTVEAGVRAGVGMNRAQDLRRHALTPVLHDRWLPRSFADGGLLLEDFSVRQLRWSFFEDADAGADDDTTELAPVVVGEPPSLTLGRLGREDRHRRHRSAADALEHVYVPAVISLGTAWIFFIAYWLPELQTLPGARFLLEQLAPLGSKEVLSPGQPLVPGQGGHSGVAAVILLAASLTLAPLARSRYWLARLALWPVSYTATIAATVAVLEVLLRGRLAADLLGVALLVWWVVAALLTTWRSLWVDIDTLPRRPGNVAWLLGAFALLTPAPIALGRSVFAPELRQAALLVAHNGIALRWGALLTPATAGVYLSGVLLAVLAWAGYLLWPPRRAASASRPVAALVAGLVALLVVGPLAGQAAGRQAEVMRTQSPGSRLGLSCGAWTTSPAGAPVQTLVVSGLSCRRVTTLTGYRELGTRESPISLSPVHADTVAGDRIKGRLVAAQYGDVVVMAASDRLDRRPSALLGLRLQNAAELWRYACPATGPVHIRFAGASSGDDPAVGRQTLAGERPAVDVDCGHGVERVNPQTGHRF